MVQKTKSRHAVKAVMDVQAPLPASTIPSENPYTMVKVERVGRHFNGYLWNPSHMDAVSGAFVPAFWQPVFQAPTLLSSVLGALESELSEAAVKL